MYCGLATVLIWFLKDYIVLILLGNIASYKVIALAFGIFSLSLIPQCIQLLITRVYYARGDNKRPAFLSIIGATLIILLAYFSNRSAIDIATAFTIGTWVSCIIFLFSITKFLKTR